MPERDPSPTTDPTGTTRRTVLRAAGLAALGGGGVSALAACSSDAEVAAPGPASAPASTAASTPAAPSTSASASASAWSSASAGAGGASIATADVPVGGGVVLKDAKYVITQPTEGEFKAFSSTCTHKGCKVAEVKETINCKCHGSKFSIEDGSVVSPPADKPLAESPVTVSGDTVTVDA